MYSHLTFFSLQLLFSPWKQNNYPFYILKPHFVSEDSLLLIVFNTLPSLAAAEEWKGFVAKIEGFLRKMFSLFSVQVFLPRTTKSCFWPWCWLITIIRTIKMIGIKQHDIRELKCVFNFSSGDLQINPLLWNTSCCTTRQQLSCFDQK